MAETVKSTEKQPGKPPSFIAILNNEERLHILNLPASKENTGSLRPGAQLKLIPGWNFVDASQWAIVKQNPQVVNMLETLIPESKAPEMNQECVGKPMLEEGALVDKKSPLAGFEELKAVAMVREIFDVAQLRELLADERRERVATALRAAIEKIDKAGARK